MTVHKPQPRALDPNPIQQAAAFSPPPTGVVKVYDMEHATLKYWSTIRIAWLSGYKINWVVPGREGAVSGSRSVWNLDARVRPVEEIHPARTARYSLTSYVLVSGRPYEEPTLGTRVTVLATARAVVGQKTSAGVLDAPTGLGETARWLPDSNTFTGGEWLPVTMPEAPDEGIAWETAEANAPTITHEFEYARRGQWLTTSSMLLQGSTYMRLNGMPLYDGAGAALPPVTIIMVAAIKAPTQYWGSLMRAVEPDGSWDLEVSNLDFRLMPDGNIHPYTWGWQYPLPLVGAQHTLSLFGFTLDAANRYVQMFTIDRTLRFTEMHLPNDHSKTSKFVLGRTAEALFDIDLVDVLMYRGPITTDEIEQICNELDAAYGISVVLSQEQG